MINVEELQKWRTRNRERYLLDKMARDLKCSTSTLQKIFTGAYNGGKAPRSCDRIAAYMNVDLDRIFPVAHNE